MNVVDGDLIALALDGRFDVIVHGCNCFCTMGAGVARRIRAEFPEAYAADRSTAPGDRAKLGTISAAHVLRNRRRITIVNAYTQFDWRGKGDVLDYEALGSAMRAVKQGFGGRRIGYPMIGAGLAGGDWSRIAPIIATALAGEDHTLVRFAAAGAHTGTS